MRKVSPAQLWVLKAIESLRQRQEKPTVRAICGEVGLTVSTVHGHLEVLRAAGAINNGPCPCCASDVIQTTKAGRALLGIVDKPAGWQPFETAPTDGTRFLVYRPDAGVFMASYRPSWNPDTDAFDGEERSFSVEGDDLTGDLPTHWRQLPEGPENCR